MTTVTERDGKHHGRRVSHQTRQTSRAERGETAASISTLPPHPGLGSQAVQRRLDVGEITPDLVASAQRTVGNAVVQRLLRHQIVRRTPDDTKKGTGDGAFRLERQGYVFFGARSDGIRFLVGVPAAEEATARAALTAIGQRIAKDNAVIKDPAYHVTTCIITNTSSRLALWKNHPTVLINRVEADTETVAHEMGHAIFYYLEQRAKTTDPDAKPAANFRIAVADIFNRLANTKTVTKKVHTRVDGKIVEEERDHPAGLWIVDPSQWKSGKQPLREHPWDDPDEFFGTAKEAYQIDRKGLEKTIERFKKVDPAVEAPMKELLALLDALFTKSALPTTALSGQRDGTAREAAAITSLKRVKDPSDVENATSFEVQLLIAKA